jgi:hypothetical protein
MEATRAREGLRTIALGGCALLAVETLGCSDPRSVAEETILRFVDAVQAEDLATLYCLLAGASPPAGHPDAAARRAEFEAWARSRYEAYLRARDAGGAPFGGDGIFMVKAFALGRGTYHDVRSGRHTGAGRLRARSEIRFGYGQINTSRLSPGTTFYVAGVPVGAIHALRVPRGPGEQSAEVLDTVELRWELVRAPATPECPEGWALESVRHVPGSETTTVALWRF